jgi:putative transposon-encoded protein
LEFASFKVTVTVEVVTPSAVTLVGEATMVDLPGLVVDVTTPAVKVTVAVGVMVIVSVESVAVYTTACAVRSVTVKVTTPLAFEGPDAAEITEAPEPAARVTVLPDTGLPAESFKVTVIVEIVAPSAVTLVGEAATVETVADTVPPWKVIDGAWVMVVESVVSVAV